MSTKNIIIIQKNDIKTCKWIEATINKGIVLLPQVGSPIKAPLFLLQTVLCRGLPKGYVVRYLNDYKSLSKTLLRLFSEIVLVLLCNLLRVKIFWICHNVDKESSTNYQFVSRIRRWIFSRVSKRIFITDPLLVGYAKTHFPKSANKMVGVSFGEITPSHSFDDEKQEIAISFIEEKRKEAKVKNEKAIVLFCAGGPSNKKYIHFDYLEELLKAGLESGCCIIAIVAGDFETTERGKALLERYKKNTNICVFKNFTRFSPDFIRHYIDFYWRGYNDWSVPFTVYEAATLRKPILALNSGFLPEMVNVYKLGAVVENSFSGLNCILDGVMSLNSDERYEEFLAEHQWGLLPQKLKEALEYDL